MPQWIQRVPLPVSRPRKLSSGRESRLRVGEQAGATASWPVTKAGSFPSCCLKALGVPVPHAVAVNLASPWFHGALWSRPGLCACRSVTHTQSRSCSGRRLDAAVRAGGASRHGAVRRVVVCLMPLSAPQPASRHSGRSVLTVLAVGPPVSPSVSSRLDRDP